MIETRKPVLKVVFSNEFGDRQMVVKEMNDSTIDNLVVSFKECLLGFGFSPELVEEYFED